MVLSLMNILHSLVRSRAILLSASSAVSVLTSILLHSVPSLPLLSTLNLTTVTVSTTILLSLNEIASSRSITVLHALWLKLRKSSHITPILRSLHWLKINERSNINSSHSPTKFSRPANLTTYTQSYLCSVDM